MCNDRPLLHKALPHPRPPPPQRRASALAPVPPPPPSLACPPHNSWRRRRSTPTLTSPLAPLSRPATLGSALLAFAPRSLSSLRVGPPASPPTSALQARYVYVDELMTVLFGTVTGGLRFLTIRFPDRHMAATWARGLRARREVLAPPPPPPSPALSQALRRAFELNDTEGDGYLPEVRVATRLPPIRPPWIGRS